MNALGGGRTFGVVSTFALKKDYQSCIYILTRGEIVSE